MSWTQWPAVTQPSVPAVLNPAAPVINSAPAVVPPGLQYTPEQWAQLQQQNWNQWAQWQQQYQQWHQQYGAEYQKSMNAIAQAAQAQPTVVGLPNVAVPPPLPIEAKPPLPTEEPPPVPSFSSQPPQPQGYNTGQAPRVSEQRPPVPYGKNNQNPNWQNQNFRYGNDGSQNKRVYDQPIEHDAKRAMTKPSWPNQNLVLAKPKENIEELSEAEKKFDKQFADWEAQFNKWKEQNAEHPDKEQYKEYEKKWEAWRAQLLERREQMRRKRLGLPMDSPSRIKPGISSIQPNQTNFNQPQSFNQHGFNQTPAKTLIKPGGLLPTPNPTTPPFGKPPVNDEPLKFRDNRITNESEESVCDFFKPNIGGGIPGLDLVKDDSKSEKKDGDVVVIDSDEKEKQKGPDLEAISKGINSILGDQKLLSMLSLVSQTQIPKASDNLTNTMSKIVNNTENTQTASFLEQSNQSFDDHSNHSEGFNQREFVNNFDDQTRSSFTIHNDQETKFDSPGHLNRGPNQFSNRFDNFKGNRFGLEIENFNRPNQFPPFGAPNQQRFGEQYDDRDKFGPNQDKFGFNQNRFGSNQDRTDRFGPPQDRFGPGQGRFGPNQDRFGPNQNRFGPNQDNFEPNQERFGPNQDRFGINQDRFGPNQDRLGPNHNRLGPNQDNFEPNQDRFNPFGSNQDNFELNQERFGPNQDRFGPNQGNFESNRNRFGLNQDRSQQDRFIPSGQNRFGPGGNQGRGSGMSGNLSKTHSFNRNDSQKNFDNYNQDNQYDENCDDYDYDAVAANFENEPIIVEQNSNEPWKQEEKFPSSNENVPAAPAPPQIDEIFQPATVIDYNHKSNKPVEPEVLIEPIYMFDYRHKPLSRIPLPQRPKWLSEIVKNIREFDPPLVRPYEPPNLRRYPPPPPADNWRSDRFQESWSHRRNYEDRPSFDDRRPYNDRLYEQPRSSKNDWKKTDQQLDMGEEKISDTEWPDDDEPEEVSKNNPDFVQFPKQDFENKQMNKSAVLIEDLICPPGRYKRPPRIVIILRGPPGSGKTFLAKLIKDKEVENGGSAPRILSLDDYFMIEQEKEVTEEGKKVKVKEMIYEYEEEMEESYRTSLIRSFKKTITDGYFSFIIVDNVNEKVKYFGEMWSFAKQNGFQVYICQLDFDVQTCSKRNIHGRSEADIEKCIANWEPTPSHHPIVDATSLLQSASIPEVEMEEVNSPESEINEPDGSEDQVSRSKWDNFDCSVDNLAKLDGVSKPLRHRTMEEYLQLDTEWTPIKPTKPGQKRVRWADLEEQKQQEKMRAIGFVVGHTNWDRMMDPTGGSSALTQTKYIEKTGRFKVDHR